MILAGKPTTVSSLMAYPLLRKTGVFNQRKDTPPSNSITKIQL